MIWAPGCAAGQISGLQLHGFRAEGERFDHELRSAVDGGEKNNPTALFRVSSPVALRQVVPSETATRRSGAEQGGKETIKAACCTCTCLTALSPPIPIDSFMSNYLFALILIIQRWHRKEISVEYFHFSLQKGPPCHSPGNDQIDWWCTYGNSLMSLGTN